MSSHREVVVVGGGVIGLSVAWALQRRDRRVLVLERGAEPGAGATRAAAGMLAPVSEGEREESALTRLGRDSVQRYPAFADALRALTGIDCGLRDDGTLWVARDRDDERRLDHLLEALRRKDLPAERLEAGEVLALEPHLSPRVVSGLRVPGDHQVDPRALARALHAAVRALGGDVRCGAHVRAVLPREGGGARVHLDGGETIDAAVAVLAAGSWATEQIESPLLAARIRPVKGQLLRLRGAAPLLRHVVRNPDVYLVPRRDGELLVGASSEEQGFDTSARAGHTLDLLRHAFAVLPSIYDLAHVETTVGLRPAARDHQPVIGPTRHPGLYAALGHYRGGVLLAPATAELLAQAIVDGRTPVALEPFLPARFDA